MSFWQRKKWWIGLTLIGHGVDRLSEIILNKYYLAKWKFCQNSSTYETIFMCKNKNILPKFYLFKNGAFKVSLSFNALNLAFGRNCIVILLWRYFRQIQTRTNRLISELGDDFEICLDWIWSYRVFPLEYGNALRSFGLEQLIDIIPPCDKAHYEAYLGVWAQTSSS